MSLVVQGARPPDIARPQLPAAVVWRRGAHRVHHRRHAALGRLRHLLFGLLRRLPLYSSTALTGASQPTANNCRCMASDPTTISATPNSLMGSGFCPRIM